MAASKKQTARDAPRRSNGQSTVRRELVENEIIQAASRLFAEHGFAGTSLQDLADALGMTRSALYYYVKSKEDILSRLVSEMTQHAASETNAIAADPDRSATDKLAAIARSIAHQRAKEPVRFLFLVRSQSALPEELAHANRAAEREVHRALVGVLEAGLLTGEFRSIDPRTTALAVVGMCNWIAWWVQARESDSADAIADTFADLAIAMVSRSDGHKLDHPGPLEVLGLVRENLSLLEKTLQDPNLS